jgi:hypothetical protein
MVTRTYEAFSVLRGAFCSTRFLEHVKLRGFARSNASFLKTVGDAVGFCGVIISENGRRCSHSVTRRNAN